MPASHVNADAATARGRLVTRPATVAAPSPAEHAAATSHGSSTGSEDTAGIRPTGAVKGDRISRAQAPGPPDPTDTGDHTCPNATDTFPASPAGWTRANPTR